MNVDDKIKITLNLIDYLEQEAKIRFSKDVDLGY